MAWYCTHRGEFYDNNGLLWTAEVEDTTPPSGGITADSTEITVDSIVFTADQTEGTGEVGVEDAVMAGSPIVFDFLSSSDDLFSGPIKGSMVTLNMWSETNFQYVSMYSAANLSKRLSIYYGDAKVLYWRGYLTPEYSEPYDDPPYEVSITANDGLGLLKDMPYKYTTTTKNDTFYTGRRFESQVILDILGKIGVTEFKEFCNLYDTLMDDDVSDSPFDQAQIDVSVFGETDDDIMSCYDVLVEVLKKYNAVIRHSRGFFWIYRPIELMTDGDVNYRYFTAYATKTNDTLEGDPNVNIRRDGVSSNVTDFNGGMLLMQTPLSKFTAEQDYGSRESWLSNFNFDLDTWQHTLTPPQFRYWTSWGAQPLAFNYTTAKEGQGILIEPDGTGINYYAYQGFGLNARQCTDVFVFSFDYMLIKTSSGTATVTFTVWVTTSNYSHGLKKDSDIAASWDTFSPTPADNVSIETVNLPQGNTGWQTVELSIASGLPADGPYLIMLHATDTANVKVAYKNIRFYSTSDTLMTKTVRVARAKNWLSTILLFAGIYPMAPQYRKAKKRWIEDDKEVVSRTYNATNAIEAPEAKQTYMLGDCEDTSITNVIEQFRGSLCVAVTGSLEQTAIDFVNDHAADYTAGGVVVTSAANAIIFESDTAGTDFTGSTSIANVSGDLAGTVSTIQANVVAVAQVDTVKVNLTSPSGTARITCKGLSRTLTYVTSVATTVSNFVTAYAADYAAIGVTLEVGSPNTWMTFTATIAGGSFGSETTIVNLTGTLSGTAETTTEPAFPKKRKDQVLLTGTSGTANITCDAVTELATFNSTEVLSYTSSWHTRGNTENKPLAELIADEMATQHERERHMIQANIRERSSDAPDVNMLYGLVDSINTYDSTERVFVPNRGTFDVRNREWTIDIHEINT